MFVTLDCKISKDIDILTFTQKLVYQNLQKKSKISKRLAIIYHFADIHHTWMKSLLLAMAVKAFIEI